MIGFVAPGGGRWLTTQEKRQAVCAIVAGPGDVGGGKSGGGLGGQSSSDPGTGGATVLERPTQTQRAKIDPGKRYKVLIFNETSQTREFIVQVLQRCLPGMGEGTAKEIADRTKKVGKAVVGAWIFEMAEAYCDSLRSSGLVADIQLE